MELFKANSTDPRVGLHRQYVKELVRRGVVLSRSALKDKDTIDLRPALNLTSEEINVSTMPSQAMARLKAKMEDEGIRNWIDKVGFYFYVPCFQEGVVIITNHRYMYWKILSLDVTGESLKIFIQDYSALEGTWHPGISVVVELTNEGYRVLEMNTQYDIYTTIDKSEMGWTDLECKYWDSLLKFYKNQFDDKDCTVDDGATAVLTVYAGLIGSVNFMLDTNKPKAMRHKNKLNRSVIYVDGEQPRKLYRSVGTLEFKSEKPPRCPSKETVVKYKVASWKARGGIRHMKDGRLIPFKESIRYRQCLKATETVPTSVIRVN